MRPCPQMGSAAEYDAPDVLYTDIGNIEIEIPVEGKCVTETFRSIVEGLDDFEKKEVCDAWNKQSSKALAKYRGDAGTAKNVVEQFLPQRV